MTYQLHQNLLKQKPYEVIQEEYAIRLDANESFLNPASVGGPLIRDAIETIPWNRYPEDRSVALREAFADYYNLNANQILAGNGSDEWISILLGSFLQVDETLLLFQPDFSMYQIFADMHQRKIAILEKPEDLKLSSEMVLASIHSTGARMVLFSNPCSPTSIVMGRDEVRRIVEGTDALVVVDEAYMDFSNESVLSLCQDYDNLVVLRTSSKAMGCAAIRLGFIVTNEKLAEVFEAIRPPYNVNGITQAIGTFVYSRKEEASQRIKQILENREDLQTALKGIFAGKNGLKVFPSETNFLYLQTEQAGWIYEQLKIASILVRNMGHGLRITVGTKDEHAALIRALSSITGAIE